MRKPILSTLHGWRLALVDLSAALRRRCSAEHVRCFWRRNDSRDRRAFAEAASANGHNTRTNQVRPRRYGDGRRRGQRDQSLQLIDETRGRGDLQCQRGRTNVRTKRALRSGSASTPFERRGEVAACSSSERVARSTPWVSFSR